MWTLAEILKELDRMKLYQSETDGKYYIEAWIKDTEEFFWVSSPDIDEAIRGVKIRLAI